MKEEILLLTACRGRREAYLAGTLARLQALGVEEVGKSPYFHQPQGPLPSLQVLVQVRWPFPDVQPYLREAAAFFSGEGEEVAPVAATVAPLEAGEVLLGATYQGPPWSWPADRFDPFVLADLSRGPLGTAWRVLERVDTTILEARRWAEDGAPHGAVVVAEEQTQGRGRGERTWTLPPGRGIAATVILRHLPPLASLSLLPLAGAVAVAMALEKELALRPRLKWPNDVWLNGRKVAGLLGEVLGSLSAATVSAGIDVNWPVAKMPSELQGRATSLLHEWGGPVSRPLILAAYLRHLGEMWQEIHRGGERVLQEFRQRALFLGEKIEVRHGEETLTGTMQDIGQDGSLILETAHGLRRLYAGDVTFDLSGR
ncbi:MAG: biotin--[acetyl-CoA-carboxylase] ligase [Bacillota bacterium]|nr:biotin--[acetyl-CoA-carboxylase] ligase [Bacillota bacterium]